VSSAGSSNGQAAQQVIVVEGGETYHREGCAMTSGTRARSTLTAAAAAEQGLRACPVCEPAATTA
jgi:hypothetical protein